MTGGPDVEYGPAMKVYGYKTTVIVGIEFVVRQCGSRDRHEVCVLNLSAIGGPSSSVDRAIAAAVQNGVVVVVVSLRGCAQRIVSHFFSLTGIPSPTSTRGFDGTGGWR